MLVSIFVASSRSGIIEDADVGYLALRPWFRRRLLRKLRVWIRAAIVVCRAWCRSLRFGCVFRIRA